jgi:hypothetical protein
MNEGVEVVGKIVGLNDGGVVLIIVGINVGASVGRKEG